MADVFVLAEENASAILLSGNMTLTADHFTRLVKVMFPDSKKAEAYSSTRTKTSVIITHALVPKLKEAIDTSCRSSSFTILFVMEVMTSSTGSTLRS